MALNIQLSVLFTSVDYIVVHKINIIIFNGGGPLEVIVYIQYSQRHSMVNHCDKTYHSRF
jgi:hypothetical protein